MIKEGTAGEASSFIGSDGQPVKLYPRPAVNSYITKGGSQVTYHVPKDGSLGDSWHAVDFDDSEWQTAGNGIGYENGRGEISGEIQKDIGEEMSGVSPSVFARYTFEIENQATNLHAVKLRVKFDDGYAAFLNGRLIDSKHAPIDLEWDSTATQSHRDVDAVQWQEVEIDVSGDLRRGKNVLAVHAFDFQLRGSDFLLSVELDVRETEYTPEPYLRGDEAVIVPIGEAVRMLPDFLTGNGGSIRDREIVFDPEFGQGFLLGPNYVNYESPHVHPIDLAPSGMVLAVANTADGRVELFDTRPSPPQSVASVPVGIDPVSVRFRGDDKLWVVNHISDTISIVSIEDQRVVRTVQTGDEPADVVFAASKAYVTCSQENSVEVFEVSNLDAASTKIRIEGEDPRALAVSADGQTIYAAVFESGNSSTILAGGIKNEAMMAYPPNVVSVEESPYQGQNPPPLKKDTSVKPLPETIQTAPEVSLIVRKDEDGVWRDGNGEDWTQFVSGEFAPWSGRPVGWDVVDNDIAMIDVDTGNVSYATRLMTTAMAMDVNPQTGELFLVGTDANNEVRFEPDLQGTFVEVMGAIVRSDDEKAVFDLNPHLDYTVRTLPRTERVESIGDPRAVQYDATGGLAYIAGMGSNNLAVVDATGARVGTIPVGEGPTGLALDTERERLFVLNRFDASVSVVDLNRRKVISEVEFFDPTPYAVKRGRRVFYNTHLTSGLGQVSCASCHLDGRMDRLAWDLGDPSAQTKPEERALVIDGGKTTLRANPMKGPMVTQTLQDISQKGPFHWRGDRMTIEDFNPTFVDLLGNDKEMSESEMEDFEKFLKSMRFPPNPYREADNSLSTNVPLPGRVTTGAFGTAGQPLPNGNAERGFKTIFSRMRHPMLGNATCIDCHSQTSGLAESRRLGNHALTDRTAATQELFKVVQLRNLYDKEGFTTASNRSLSGFGFFHDGSVDTLERFVSQDMFALQSDQDVADTVAFLLSFSGNGSSASESRNWSSSPSSAPSIESHALVGTQIEILPEDSLDVRSDKLDPFIRIARDREVELVARVYSEDAGIPKELILGVGTTRAARFTNFDGSEAYTGSQLMRIEGSHILVTVVAPGQAKRHAFDRDGDLLRNDQETMDLFPEIAGINNPFSPYDPDVTGDGFTMGADGVPDFMNDFDGDGQTNLRELTLGTNPADGWISKVPFDLTATPDPTGSGVVLTWNAEFGVAYQVQESNDLLNWVDLPNQRSVGDTHPSGPMTLSLPSIDGDCFLRVRISK